MENHNSIPFCISVSPCTTLPLIWKFGWSLNLTYVAIIVIKIFINNEKIHFRARNDTSRGSLLFICIWILFSIDKIKKFLLEKAVERFSTMSIFLALRIPGEQNFRLSAPNLVPDAYFTNGESEAPRPNE